jgi:hypothetical protein
MFNLSNLKSSRKSDETLNLIQHNYTKRNYFFSNGGHYSADSSIRTTGAILCSCSWLLPALTVKYIGKADDRMTPCIARGYSPAAKGIHRTAVFMRLAVTVK